MTPLEIAQQLLQHSDARSRTSTLEVLAAEVVRLSIHSENAAMSHREQDENEQARKDGEAAAQEAFGDFGEHLTPSSAELPLSKLPGELWLAKWFHDTYESKAAEFGYETKPETRVFDATTPNGKLMIAVCAELRKQCGVSSATGSSAPTVSAPPGVTVTVSYDAPLWLEARVTRVDGQFGLGFVEVTATAGRYFPFTFDRIIGYRGEKAKDIGLREGAIVHIEVRDGAVSRLSLKGPLMSNPADREIPHG